MITGCHVDGDILSCLLGRQPFLLLLLLLSVVGLGVLWRAWSH